MDNQYEVRQGLVMVRALVLPTLVKEIIQFIPLLEFKYSFQLELDNLEVFRDNISLRRSSELVNAFCRGTPKFLAVSTNFGVILKL